MNADEAGASFGDDTTALAASNQALTVVTVQRQDVVILTVHGSLDVLTAAHLTAAVRDALAHDSRGLIIDLSGTDFLASAGMTALVSAYEATTPKRFGVVATGPSTARPLQLVGLDRTFALYPPSATRSPSWGPLSNKSGARWVSPCYDCYP